MTGRGRRIEGADISHAGSRSRIVLTKMSTTCGSCSPPRASLDHTSSFPHSYGGLVALLYARLHPEEVAGLVMVDAAYRSHEAGGRRRRAGWMGRE